MTNHGISCQFRCVSHPLPDQFRDGIVPRLQERTPNAEKLFCPLAARAVFVDENGPVVGHLPVQRGSRVQETY